MTARVFFVVALLPFALGAAKKDRTWKTGTLIESAETTDVAGSAPGGLTVGPGPAAGGQRILYATNLGYVIKGEGTGFMVELRVLPSTIFHRSKRPSVTIHGPVKYSYEGGRFYLLDEQGEEFEMIVMKKEVLPPPPAPAPSAPVAPKP